MGNPKTIRPQFTLTALLALFVFVWSALVLVGIGWFLCLMAIFLIIGTLVYKYQANLVEILVVLAVIGILIALILPARSRSRAKVHSEHCAARLSTVAQAIAAYHDDHGCYPPACIRDDAGQPMHSWRVLILPYLGHDDLYAQYRFDESWNGPNNSKLLKARPKEYLCAGWNWRNWKQGETTCVAVVGKDTMWPDGRSVRSKDILDGIDQTIMIGEISPAAGIQWLEPRDVTSAEVTLGIDEFDWSNIASSRGLAAVHRFDAGFNSLIAMADGSVRGLTKDTKPEVLSTLLTPSGGESIDLDSVASKRLDPSNWLTIAGKIVAAVLLMVSLTVMIVSVLRHRRALAAAQEVNPDQTPPDTAKTDATETNEGANPSGTA